MTNDIEIFEDRKLQALVEKSLGVFLKYGLIKSTMDVISKELNISKKTIYKYVNNRNELIQKATIYQIKLEKYVMHQILSKNLNAVLEMAELTKFWCKTLNGLNQDIHKEMKTKFTDAWDLWMAHQTENVLPVIELNIEKGKKEGLYRTDIHTQIITKIFIQKTDTTFNGELFPQDKFKFLEVLIQYVKYHLYGLATEAGITEIKKIDL